MPTLWFWRSGTGPGRRGRARSVPAAAHKARAAGDEGAARAEAASGAKKSDHRSRSVPRPTQATLGELGAGQTGRVLDVRGRTQVVARLAALGFVVDTPILMVQNFGSGPVIVEVRGTQVALGRREASKVHLTQGE